jgi:hypothetical protein
VCVGGGREGERECNSNICSRINNGNHADDRTRNILMVT